MVTSRNNPEKYLTNALIIFGKTTVSAFFKVPSLNLKLIRKL
jgi:hypothetical protein